MTRPQPQTHPLLYVAISLVIGAVFVADLATPRGFVVWMAYIAPLALCLFGRQPQLPLAVAVLCTVTMVAGYYLSPIGVDMWFAQMNRIIGVAVLWSGAISGYFFVRGRLQTERLMWMQQAEAHLARDMLGRSSVADIATGALSVLAGVLPLAAGAVYFMAGGRLQRVGAWGLDPQQLPEAIERGQGLLGQAVTDQRIVTLAPVSADYMTVRSALGGQPPRAIVIAPFSGDAGETGAIELGLADRGAMEDASELLSRVCAGIGTTLRSAAYRERLQELLAETQQQSRMLATQQEQLRASNEELEQQSRALQQSQARLENQTSELEQANVQLEEQTHRLERQRQDLLAAQADLKRNAAELEKASRYKSEFLANMSHELRTPLNSSMILSQLLAENKGGNLTDEQVRYAQIIRSANNDLLAMINDILDLSKIEAGRLELEWQRVDLRQHVSEIIEQFEPLAAQRGLELAAQVGDKVPATIDTDAFRLQQILRNLLSNAIKFTEAGSVRLEVEASGDCVEFSVRDTGIGIPDDQQRLIFDAFRQADGTTSRRYGGTGLGLSICRELAQLLGGSIAVASEQGKGSVFSLRLPVRRHERAAGDRDETPAAPAARVEVPAPAAAPARPTRRILVIEDDRELAKAFCDLIENLDFECVTAESSREGIELALRLAPSAIVVNERLPDGPGSRVVDELQRHAATRAIPVHVVPALTRDADDRARGAALQALSHALHEELSDALDRLQQRVAHPIRRVLVVEDDEHASKLIAKTLGAAQAEIVIVSTVAAALKQLSSADSRTFDCVVLDLALPDGSGRDLLQRIAQDDQFAFPPVIVYTGRALSPHEEQQLRRYAASIIIKGPRSPQRLLDEVMLFVHQVEQRLPESAQRPVRAARQRDAALEGRVVLLAEDDARNVFSLTRALEPLGVEIEVARNGREALEALARRPKIDLVLMDMMMPEMDGLTAMREIRQQPAHSALPIIALTAKAMPEDRKRCLDAGASDYIAKPIDIGKLIGLIRVWMPR